LDEVTTLRFVDPNVSLGVGLLPPKAVPMTSVEYAIFCRVEKNIRRCTSSEESPTVGVVNKVSKAGVVDRYAFDPSLEFHGAKDTLHEGAWFGHRLTGKRRYYVRTAAIPVQRGVDLTVQLPTIVINGKAHIPPKLNFRAVTEQVCRLVPLA
jgi:hypothetical protein